MTSTRVRAELGERIAEDGPAAHHRHLQHLSTLVADTAPAAPPPWQTAAPPKSSGKRALAVASAVLLRRSTATRAAFGLAGRPS